MKALILAAGFGTRLRPWTDKLPKPLIPVAGVEPLFFALSKLEQAGIDEVYVNGHHLAAKIEQALRDFAPLFPRMKLKFSHEQSQILGTGGAILKLVNEGVDLNDGLLVLNGDTLAHLDLTKVTEGETSLAVSFDPKYLTRYQPLWVDKNNDWVGSVRPSNSENVLGAHFLGVHYLSGSNLKLIASKKLPTQEIDLFNGIYSHLKQANLEIKAVEFLTMDREFWIDLNKQEYFDEAKTLVLTKFSDLWKDLLKKRHPGWTFERAQAHWPL